MNHKLPLRAACLLLAPTLCMAPASARPPVAAPAHGEASLIAAEDARFAAQIRHDVPAIAAGLGVELVYCHATGRRQSREDYLGAFQTGSAAYRRIEPSERIVHVYGDVGTTRAVLTMQVGDRQMRSSVLGVYVWRDRRWQLVSWQTTPLPDA
jgi:hypothetical protein